MDKRVNSDADPIDLIRQFLHMTPSDETDEESDDEDGGVELATD